MGETTTLTIRIDETLKAELEQAAKAADQSVTDYVVRAVKLRMAPQCPQCGRTEQPVGGAAFSQQYLDFISRAKAEHFAFTVTVLEGTERRAYWGQLRYNVPQNEGMLVMMIKSAQVPIPRSLVTGWAEDDSEGGYFQRLLGLGYADGNAWVLRAAGLRKR